MSKVMIVTDSTANIPSEIVNNYPIRVLPLHVLWGRMNYKDGVDIQPQEFYERLLTDKVLPSTSQTTPEEFKVVYDELLQSGYDILSIHISSSLSGTLDSASQAKKTFSNAKIELVDSRSTSMAMGFQVLSAARLAQSGASLDQCKIIAREAISHTGVYFAVNTLEFLHRGGRIGGAAKFMGTVLNMKPLLELSDGKIEAVEKVRTLSKTLDRLIELVKIKVNEQNSPYRFSVVHANSRTSAEDLLTRIMNQFPADMVAEGIISDVSPVLGNHAGPGALGLAYMAGM